LKSKADRVVVIESLLVGKTKDARVLLDKIGAARSTLVVVEDKTAELERALRNLNGVVLTHAMYVNVCDVMNADQVVITEKALAIMTEWLKKESTTAPRKSNIDNQKSTTKGSKK
jgi:ribosomal protein L4